MPFETCILFNSCHRTVTGVVTTIDQDARTAAITITIIEPVEKGHLKVESDAITETIIPPRDVAITGHRWASWTLHRECVEEMHQMKATIDAGTGDAAEVVRNSMIEAVEAEVQEEAVAEPQSEEIDASHETHRLRTVTTMRLEMMKPSMKI